MSKLSIVTLFIWTGVFLVAFGGLLFFVLRRRSDDLSPIVKKISPILPVLSLLLGTSVSLASAVVAVNSALLAANVSKMEHESETRSAMQERSSTMVRAYSDLAFAISRLIRAGFGVLVYGEEIVRASSDEDLSPRIKDSLAVFVEALDGLDSSLQNVLFDQYTRDLLKNSRIDGALSYIGENAAGVLTEVEVGASLEFDFVSFLHYVHFSRVDLKSDAVSSVKVAYCTLLLNGGKKRLKYGDLGSAEWVAFSGYLLFTAWKDDSSDGIYLYSLGLAMLLDLFHMIPGEETIREYVQVVEDGEELVGVPAPFDAGSVVGNRFAGGMRELSTRPELVFFRSTGVEDGC
ncbi:MAG: hypothetical protein OXL41_13300 [Nitrospinae bacterium]|nr:hypothetical protein [Nitrospinota bacterium]